MSNYKFGKPYKSQDWYVFPDSTLDNLNVDDCVSSVTGKCENTESVQDCIKICQDNQPCFAGYFIETPDKKNLCVPVRKVHKDYGLYYRLSNPSIYYRLRNPSIYPELSGSKSTVFINQIYRYPPDHGNTIFFTDKFVLTNLSSGKSLGITDEGNFVVKDIMTNNPVSIQFLPEEISRSAITQYNPVYYGDKIIINIPGTAYVLRNDTKEISWIMKPSSIKGSENIFRVFAYDKKEGETLDYSDTLYFTGENQPVVYDSNFEILKMSSTNIEDEKDKGNMSFKIIPKVRVYYCDGDCKSVILEDTDKNGEKASYKGSPVSRNPSCWGMCDKKNTNNNSWWIIPLITAIVLLIVLAIIIRNRA